MNPVIEKFVQPVVDRSVDLATMGVKRSRKFAEASADMVASSTKSVALVSDKGLKLNKISHNMLARLLTEQTHMVEGGLKAVSKRLDVAANADSFQMLVSGQIEMLPKTRDRLIKDGQKIVAVFSDTGTELRDWFVGSVSDFRQRGEKVARKTRKKVTKTATKTRKKASGTSKTTKKKVNKARKTAGKTVRKTAKRRTRRAA